MNSTKGPDFLDWKRLATGFEATSAEQSISVALNGQGEPAPRGGVQVGDLETGDVSPFKSGMRQPQVTSNL